MPLKGLMKKIFFSTVRITLPGERKAGASTGTGFLYTFPLSGSRDDDLLLLVSARHVIKTGGEGRVLLNFHKKQEDTGGPQPGSVIQVECDLAGGYCGHPDPCTDLACVRVPEEIRERIFYTSLHPEMICRFDGEEPAPGDDAWFAGYPENCFDVKHNLPIIRKSCIASIPAVDYNSGKVFIMDARVLPGSSGSPAFAPAGGELRFIGVVTQAVIKNGRLEPAPAVITGDGLQRTPGLGIVIKPVCLQEMIECAVNKNF